MDHPVDDLPAIAFDLPPRIFLPIVGELLRRRLPRPLFLLLLLPTLHPSLFTLHFPPPPIRFIDDTADDLPAVVLDLLARVLLPVVGKFLRRRPPRPLFLLLFPTLHPSPFTLHFPPSFQYRLHPRSDLVDDEVGMIQPLVRPDPIDLPPQRLQHPWPHLVAIARIARVAIVLTIALDPEEVAPRLLRVRDPDIDPVPRAPDLRIHRKAFGVQPGGERFHHGRSEPRSVHIAVAGGTEPVVACMEEIIFEVAQPVRVDPVVLQRLRLERREHDRLVPRPRHRHIEPTVPTALVQRAEVIAQRPVRPRSVPHADQDDIALVSLHRLQVLDEERLLVAVHADREPLLEGEPRLLQFCADRLLLLDGERDDAH